MNDDKNFNAFGMSISKIYVYSVALNSSLSDWSLYIPFMGSFFNSNHEYLRSTKKIDIRDDVYKAHIDVLDKVIDHINELYKSPYYDTEEYNLKFFCELFRNCFKKKIFSYGFYFDSYSFYTRFNVDLLKKIYAPLAKTFYRYYELCFEVQLSPYEAMLNDRAKKNKV